MGRVGSAATDHSDEDEDSHVSKVVKWLMFVFNFFFWVIGGMFIGIGSWAYIEKNNFDYGKVPDKDKEDMGIYDLMFDLTIVLMGFGIMLFLIAFPGCLGALRENVLLLRVFMYTLGGLLTLQVCCALLAFIFSDELQKKINNVLKNNGIERYRDDPDLRNFVDFLQQKFECCGVKPETSTSTEQYAFQTWSRNPYFNCTTAALNPSPERCGVPHSCCVKADNLEANIKNTMCGYNVNEVDGEAINIVQVGKTIHTIDCVSAMIKKAKKNLFLMGGAALGFTIPQLIDLYIGYIMIRDIRLQAGELA